jgi:hypothetical protein
VLTVIEVLKEYDVSDSGNFLSLATAEVFKRLYALPSEFVIVNVEAKSAPCSIVILTAGTAIFSFKF